MLPQEEQPQAQEEVEALALVSPRAEVVAVEEALLALAVAQEELVEA